MQLRKKAANASLAESPFQPGRSLHAAGLRLFAHESGGNGAGGVGSGAGTTTGEGSAQAGGQLAGTVGLLFGTLAQLLSNSATPIKPASAASDRFLPISEGFMNKRLSLSEALRDRIGSATARANR
ncbi:MAG: hypothetical protein ABI612_10275 [Betaproteobacteria bacterium]